MYTWSSADFGCKHSLLYLFPNSLSSVNSSLPPPSPFVIVTQAIIWIHVNMVSTHMTTRDKKWFNKYSRFMKQLTSSKGVMDALAPP